jgi:hypothetical protein
MSGPSFTLRELRIAAQHCALVEVLFREAARVVEECGLPWPIVSGFTREYWTDQAWSEAVAQASSLQEPSPDGAAAFVADVV